MEEVLQEEQECFSIVPKADCPHIQEQFLSSLQERFLAKKEEILLEPCKVCSN